MLPVVGIRLDPVDARYGGCKTFEEDDAGGRNFSISIPRGKWMGRYSPRTGQHGFNDWCAKKRMEK